MFNSLFIAGSTALLCTYFSALTAYAIHAYNFKLKKVAYVFILAIMMVPVQVSTLGFVDLMGKVGLMDSYIPLIIPAIAAPIVFFFLKQYMDSTLPLEIIEAARIDGSGEFKTFNRIVIPIMKPAIAVQLIFTLLLVGITISFLVDYKIKQQENPSNLIAQLRSADFLKFDMGQVYMLIFLAIFPVILIYLFLSKYIVQGVAVGSVKG